MKIPLLRFTFFIVTLYLIQSCKPKETDPSPGGSCLPSQSSQGEPATLSHGNQYGYTYDGQKRPIAIAFGQLYRDTTGKYQLSYNAAGQVSQIQVYGYANIPYVDSTTYTPVYNSQGQLVNVNIHSKYYDSQLGLAYDNAGRCIKFESGSPNNPEVETRYEYLGDTLIKASQVHSKAVGEQALPFRVDSFYYYANQENRLHSLQGQFFTDVFPQYVGNNDYINYTQNGGVGFPLILFTPPFRQNKKMLKRWITSNWPGSQLGQLQTSLRTEYAYEYNPQGWPLKQKATYQPLLPDVLPAFTVVAVMDYQCR